MGPLLPVVIAAVAALAIILVALGLAGGSAVDPVQARLTQLGTMQARNLEEIELQQPFFDRTIRPLAGRLSDSISRFTSASFTQTTQKRLAMAGNPGDLRVADWLGIKAVSAIVFAILFFLVFTFLLASGPVMGLLLGWPASCSATSPRSSGWAGAYAAARRRSSSRSRMHWTC